MFYYFSIAKASYMYDERYTRSTIANLIAWKVGGGGLFNNNNFDKCVNGGIIHFREEC